MEVYILDQSFTTLFIIDKFESFLWVERYSGYGDCELYTKVQIELLEFAKKDNYLWIKDSKRLMIIEEREISTDVELGVNLMIRGRSLISLLDRRLVWKQTLLSGSLQDAIAKLLNENAITPTDSDRVIPGLVFRPSTDPEILALTVNAQFTGDNLYSAIKTLLDSKELGFEVIFEEPNFVFQIYKGTNRSYSQLINPYVIFSPDYENILNSNYLESDNNYRNVGLVAGEGEGIDRKTTSVGAGVGLARRELFIDARDISSATEEGELNPEEYTAKLAQRGTDKIAEMKQIESFEGEVDANRMFIFGKDFFLGDIVQIVNEFGIEASSRVTEIIRKYDITGANIIPTFTIV